MRGRAYGDGEGRGRTNQDQKQIDAVRRVLFQSSSRGQVPVASVFSYRRVLLVRDVGRRGSGQGSSAQIGRRRSGPGGGGEDVSKYEPMYWVDVGVDGESKMINQDQVIATVQISRTVRPCPCW